VREVATGQGSSASAAAHRIRRILVDGRPLQGDSAARGIGSYLSGLLEGVAGIGFAPQVALLLARGVAAPRMARDLGLRAVAAVPRLERRAQVLADPLLVGTALRHTQSRLYHAVEYGQPWRSPVPVVVTVHDLIPFLLPGYSWRSRLLRRPGLRLLPRADAVITPSQATADDCIRIGGVPPERIQVIPHGLAGSFRPATPEAVEDIRRRFRLPRPYLLGVGTFEPRKGLQHLVAVTRRLRRAHDLDLVVAGSQGIFAPAVRAQLAALGQHGRDLGFVPASDLATLYSGAAAFVFPSAYEGFGLPLLEAMGCGTVAVTFANSALPEVAGGAAVLVPDGDQAALGDAVWALLDNPDEAERRRRLGIQVAASFSWRKAALQTVEVYQRVLGERLI